MFKKLVDRFPLNVSVVKRNDKNLKPEISEFFNYRFLVSLSIRVFGAFSILIYMTLMLWRFETHVTADMFFLLASAPLVSSILKGGQENRLIIVVAKSSIERTKGLLVSLLARYIFSAVILVVYLLCETEYSKFLAIIILGQFLAQHSLISGYLQAIGKLNTSLLVRLCYPGLIILILLAILSSNATSSTLFNYILGSYLIVFLITVGALFSVHRKCLFVDLMNRSIVSNFKLKNAFFNIIYRSKNRNFAIYESLNSILQTFPVLISGFIGNSEAIIFLGYLSRVSKVPKVFVSMYTNYAVHKHARIFKVSGSSIFFKEIVRQAKAVFFALLFFSLSVSIAFTLVTPTIDIEFPLIDAMEKSVLVVLIYLLGETFGAPAMVMVNRFLIVDRLKNLNLAISLCLVISSMVLIFDTGIMSISVAYFVANLIFISLVIKFHVNSL